MVIAITQLWGSALLLRLNATRLKVLGGKSTYTLPSIVACRCDCFASQ